MTTYRLLLVAIVSAVLVGIPASAQRFRRPVTQAAVAVDVQGLVDAALADRRQEVRLPAGVYRLAKPLVLGRHDLSTVRLIGAGKRQDNHSPYGGTVLIADHDGPAIVIQGGRGSGVEGLSVYGPYFDELLYKPFRGGDRAAWPGEDRRYNPSAGVAVDVGPHGSGHTTIRDVEIGGFGVAVVTYPNGGDGNGDFLSIEHCRLIACRDGVSISHTQSRTVRVDRTTFQCLHTAVTNAQHGKRLGEWDGWIANCDFNQVHRVCRLSQAYAGPTVFQSCYGELVGSLGDFDSGGARAATRTVFRDCRFVLDLEPAGLIADGGSILLDGGIYQTPDIPVVGSACEVRGAKFRPRYYEAFGPFEEGRRQAVNRHPLIDRPHPAKTGTGWGDIKSAAYFPNAGSDYQIGWDGPYPKRVYDVWEKRTVFFAETSAILPDKAKPAPGDVLIDDVGMIAWSIVTVAADGKTCKLDRVNFPGKKVGESGHFYHLREATK